MSYFCSLKKNQSSDNEHYRDHAHWVEDLHGLRPEGMNNDDLEGPSFEKSFRRNELETNASINEQYTDYYAYPLPNKIGKEISRR
jgi:hypothetical protein